MIIIRDSVRVLFEGIVISTFILEPIGDIQKCFKVRVTGRDYTKDSRCIVIVWKNLIHGFIDEICYEVKTEFMNFLFIPFHTLRAMILGHSDRFKRLWKTHCMFALWETSACNKD